MHIPIPLISFKPVYGTPLGPRGADALQERRIDHYGVYLQDTVSFGDHWKLLLGNRYDVAGTHYDRNEKIVTDKWDRAFSPRAGLVFQPVEKS